LVSKGYKVAIVEQLEDPATAVGIVKRDVVRMITPGTMTETTFLDEKKNNYLGSIFKGEDGFGVCFADVSTGSVNSTEFHGENAENSLMSELGIYEPKEVVVNCSIAELGNLGTFLKDRIGCLINDSQADRFDYITSKDEANKHFSSMPNEFLQEDNYAILAFGALISYAKETQKNDLDNISNLNYYKNGRFMEIDINTRRNLELTETMRRGEKKGSLLWVLDKTKTAAGARLLRSYIDFPLINPNQINRRQNAVAELFERFIDRGDLMEILSGILDLERIMTKIVYGTGNCRDLRALSATAKLLPELKEKTSRFNSEELKNVSESIDDLSDIYDLIDKSIIEDPPFSVREAGFIKPGFNEDVDKLRDIINGGKSWLSEIEEKEKNATGIKTLKVGYNKVFGYYIEVSKSFVNDVPDRFIRKQTLVNGERYITEELKEMESQMLGASERIKSLEYQIFTAIREKVSQSVHRVQKTAYALAKLDVYCSLAEVAQSYNYSRPEVDYSDVIEIKDGRHPVVERFSKDTYFVPNDTDMDGTKKRFMLITGPNMAGKSTYMRQIATICLMAQMGSFVPAESARIGVVDKLFTRVGASDDLAMGQSTFMLEMSEVAYILSHATKNSLIIYDEIGRGTSTFDGMSIARAVAEYTLSKKVGAKTLFATHYHELTVLENECEGVINYNIAAKKKADDIVFLRKIVRGSADDSYGIEVAKLAGVPKEVIKRARDILETLETTGIVREKSATPGQQEDLMISFEDMKDNEVAEKLRNTDINTLTPLEAINLVYELKKMLN
jgi:DNA mismatch repair protein MutS